MRAATPLHHRQEYTTHTARVGASSVTEHRVSRRTRSSGSAVALLLALALLLLAAYIAHREPLAATATRTKIFTVAAAAAAMLFLYAASRSVLYQSLTPLPSLGVQLGTTRGLSLAGFSLPLSSSRRFVPLSELSTVVIHEGLVRFNVRFYLGIVRGRDVVVAFDEVHPLLEVLKEVYHATREELFDEYDEGEE